MKTISVNLPEAFVNGMESLVQRGLYANRSEAIRVAVRDLLKRELVDPIPYKQCDPVAPGRAEEPVFFASKCEPPPYISFLKSPLAPEKPQVQMKSNTSASKQFISPFFLILEQLEGYYA
jgi:hypothetical protein